MGRTFEVIFIDDGSRDGTEGALKSLSEKFSRIKAVRFRRNCGQTAALAAGFQYASGDIIVTLDGDLQNDPEDIPNLVAKLEEGYDVVSGWRKDRKDNFVKRTLPSMVANKLISSVSGVALHDYGCSLKAYRAETAKALPLYGELHRFIPALAGIEGARIAEMAVCHHPRRFGKSKYTITRTFRVILDLMTVVFLRRFMTRPLHVFGGAGLVSFALGFLVCAYLAMDKLAFGHSLGNRPLLDLGVLLIVTGVQLISTGIIAEILIRTYFESQHKAIFRVKELYGFGGEQGEKE
jgi:glycosyltransferase involved in cell wall biosynthesis